MQTNTLYIQITILFCLLFIDISSELDCASSTYENEDQNVCESCYKVFNGCDNCADETNCYVCLEGFYHKTPSTEQCSICVDQYGQCDECFNNSCHVCHLEHGPHDVGLCLKCRENCIKCSYLGGDYGCGICQPGFKVDESTQNCVQCQDDECCQFNQSGDCTGCNIGYGLDENGVCQPDCSIDYCDQCGFQNGQKYCTNCASGYLAQNQQCVTCNDQFCDTCSDFSTCVKCKEGYFLQDSQCYRCSENCETCLSATECKQCKPEFYQDEQFQCQTCDINNCKYCATDTKCMECQPGNYINEQNYSCLSCPNNCSHCRYSADEDEIQCTDCFGEYILTNKYRCMHPDDLIDGGDDEEGLNGNKFNIKKVSSGNLLVFNVLLTFILYVFLN